MTNRGKHSNKKMDQADKLLGQMEVRFPRTKEEIWAEMAAQMEGKAMEEGDAAKSWTTRRIAGA